jgi:hypothetical protein
MLHLIHRTDDCHGRWQRGEEAAGVRWYCGQCGAIYPDGVPVRFAVLREYDLELILFRLGREGRRLLSTSPEARRAGEPLEPPENP